MRIVFFGTPSFAVHLLQDLLEHGVEVVAVVTRIDKPKGRKGTPQPSPVKEYVATHAPHIPLHQPLRASDDAFVALLAEYQADLFIVAAYGEIVKQALLDLPRLCCINVHASVLPKYRGAAPVQRCLMQGDEESGVTIMRMVRKLDAGDIIAIARCPLDDEETCGQLLHRLALLAAPLLREVLDQFANGGVTFTPQDPAAVTFAEKIELEDCQIDWSMDALHVHNLIRGVSPSPGAWCWVEVKGERKRLKVTRAAFVPTHRGAEGQLSLDEKKNVLVACKQGGVQLLLMQLEGKRLMPAADVLRGVSLRLLPFASTEVSE